MYFSHLSAGVNAELDLIVSASRQAATVLICDERTHQGAKEQLRQLGFMHLMDWGAEGAAKQLNQAMKHILREPFSGRFAALPLLEAARQLPQSIADWANKRAFSSMQEARAHVEAGEIAECENAIVRAIVLCCFAGYDEGRGSAFLALARTQVQARGEAILARENYERAIATYQRLASSSATAAETLDTVKREFAMLPQERSNA